MSKGRVQCPLCKRTVHSGSLTKHQARGCPRPQGTSNTKTVKGFVDRLFKK